jgi:predicted secreted protein
MKKVRIPASTQSAAITLIVGETVQIDLTENPTTGYCWQIEQMDKRLALIKSTFLPAGYTMDVAGAAGVRSFYVMAKSAGTGTILLANKIPWSPNPVESVNISITIMELSSS